MFRSVSDHRDRNGVVLDTVHIERSWQSREDHRDRGLLLPQPISAEDFPFPRYVTPIPLHFMDLFMKSCAFSPGIQFTVKLWELLGSVLSLSTEREVAPTNGKCTSVKIPCILGYDQWRRAAETLFTQIKVALIYLPSCMTFFCTAQMEEVWKKTF